jgi:hypothetical protein
MATYFPERQAVPSYWNLPQQQYDGGTYMGGYGNMYGNMNEGESLISESPTTVRSQYIRHQSSDGNALKKKTTHIHKPISQLTFLLSVTILATGLFIFTIWFAQATFSSVKLSSIQNAFKYVTIGNTLGILRTSQEITSVLTGYALNSAFEIVQWTWAGGNNGMPLLSFLALSPSTSVLGVTGIALSKSSRTTDRMLSIMRLFLVSIVWITGFLLFCESSFKSEYSRF